ncbi:DUF4209 domain-containing protein [Lactonifactor sp. BIOML-A3]|uniref:DUF4209 domain-containing protein n=1 Tax=unclassified Lactonifactor TaxID=2636670 RepID=UPI0012AF4375|nr:MULTISPECIES: DUF4209 domain-containing protein [unclassified Lactonifactor]MSA01735.1 DUF4209 domain-containing protein [Lactonifactor sp. BIOML-A5]MSA08733.1 DUF4209 domain-containing protein [Lactonifactor sp. BIOML-A4]MSA13871.1 DUF4209 domain-containing protein [Lactonifactor sp. BIOML-A3]MSA17112.1 DUF4209 domain-containing protein [Lactonifactor sp. BIOML-A2]MSA37791.1 DUF4209 domain-containing protein [Lactonifactor sp. BIOML-A1]
MTIYDFFSKYNDVYKIDKVRFDRNVDEVLAIDEEEKELYTLIVDILSLHEDYRHPDKLFGPKMRWEGKRTFDISDLTESDFELLSALDLEKLPIVIATRIRDVLWVTKKDYKSAIKAAESYLVLFEKTYDNKNWTTCVDMICRALCIAAQTGKNKDLYNSVCETIKASLIKENGKDPLFLSVVLLEQLIEQKYGSYSDYLDIADNIISFSVEQNHFEHKVEEAYKVKRQLLVWGKQSTHDCDMDLVAYYESKAEKKSEAINDLFISIKALEKAIHIARNNQEPEKAAVLLRKLGELQKQVPGQMAKISHSVDMKEPHDKIVKLFEDTSFTEDLWTLTQLIHIYTKDELRKQINEEGNFFSGMFGASLLDGEGRRVIDLPPLHGNETNEHVIELHMFRKLTEYTDISGRTAIYWALQEINRKHKFDEKDLLFIFNECAIVRPGREKILASGFNMALHSRFYEALHILAPQAENTFRYIAEENGGLVYTLEDDDTSNAKTLSSIFDIPELVDCYDPDYLFTFRGLLNEKAGSNLRNMIAHGILEPGAANSGSSIYFCFVFFKIFVATSHGFYMKLDEEKNEDDN